MPSAAEAEGQQNEQESTLAQGAGLLSDQQEVQFRRYQKVTLAQDGFVFLVATPAYMTAKGSLHYATERRQDEDQTIGTNQVTLTSLEQISELNVIAPDAMWIGDWPTQESAPPLKVAFSSRGMFYKEADLFHYVGFAVYPTMLSQLIENEADLPPGPIVSNSLPIWLLLSTFAGITVPVYPSFLVPDNLRPPYIAVHIPPELTESLAAAPIFVNSGQALPNSGDAPLYSFMASTPARDTVVLTLYGFSNQMAWQYLAMLYESSVNGGAAFGFANSPVPVDDKSTQPEITAIAQKKTLTILANYNQGAADAAARRYILSAAISSIQINGGRPAFGTGALVQDQQTIFGEGTVFE